MKLLWICGLPYEVQQNTLGGQDHGAYAAWSWVMGHLPPPAGVELHIACRTARHTRPQEFDYRGARFHLVPVRARARLFCLFQFDGRYFRDLAARLRPDVVHGWGTEDAFAHVALQLADRHLIQIQGNINAYRQRVRMPRLTFLSALSERIALARARHVVAENEYALNSAVPMLRTQSRHVVEHPIRNDFLTATPAEGSAKQVVFVGAIDDRKGITDAVHAFAAAAPSDWRLHIIGAGPAERVARLQREILGCSAADRIRHTPRMDGASIVAEMQRSSVFVLPTRIDTGPTALKEALAMGLWPVCYDNSGPGHYMRLLEFGSLAADLNPGVLTDVLREVISSQPWRAARQRSKINSQIRPLFSRDRIWQDLLKVYHHICSA
jgi:glycosyltransferase involved in cell wall biosynthesis